MQERSETTRRVGGSARAQEGTHVTTKLTGARTALRVRRLSGIHSKAAGASSLLSHALRGGRDLQERV
ncbi:hypothetical protein NDU88_006898 [Pleurodeles waltl]|uniref:Uncharacterized protein n=1 Tax=Pleurodeles waltl TaxID=8319 RepID=A0AAV7PK69_PLEWA|nr:hypothetical protein NDU88_006898 [Pleurodeles waltl]